MNRLLILLAAALLNGAAFAQAPAPVKAQLNEKSIVKDADGVQYPKAIWQQLLMKGYALKVIRAEEPSEFLIYKLSEEELAKRLAAMPKPKETASFTTGSAIPNFRATDMNGVKYNLKEMAGKVVVLNFWFINCPPCRMEMPDLNELVARYKDKEVVFIAVALDSYSDIKYFLKSTPFNYNIVSDGRWASTMYKVKAYPTHLVLDQAGKVLFHTAGYGPNTIYWINKSIDEALAGAKAGASGD